MTPYYADDWLTVYHGDAATVLATLEPESVHCVVTSPPYWGLRDYGEPGQLGLEPTPEAYVAALVAVFREVRRVLRSDGTVWLNLGDSYANTGGMTGGTNSKDGGSARAARMFAGAYRPLTGDLKPKDLVGIPWMVAFALRADGWYLRSDIIWSKPNPMPESITDRPTKSHEYLFLLSKSPRYYFDAEAVREVGVATDAHSQTGGGYKTQPPGQRPQAGNRGPTWQERKAAGGTAGNVGVSDTYQNGVHGEGLSHDLGRIGSRNIRSVWTVSTQPYPGAHFATFPTKLIEPCIKAGTSERGVCPECGAPWEREVQRPEEPDGLRNRGNGAKLDYHTRQTGSGQKLQDWMDANPKTTTGWRPSCMCHPIMVPEPVPATVLDPFAGSGTTGLVAQHLSRRAVLIDPRWNTSASSWTGTAISHSDSAHDLP